MHGHDRSADQGYGDPRDEIRPTVWGYVTWTTARCLQGDVPGAPARVVQRTDVLVPGLTPTSWTGCVGTPSGARRSTWCGSVSSQA